MSNDAQQSAETGGQIAPGNEKTSEVTVNGKPRSLAIAQRGIFTSHDFAACMSALISDTIEGRMTPQQTNAAVNAGGKLLKVVELNAKYGTTAKGGQQKVIDLVLTSTPQPEDEAASKKAQRLAALKKELADLEGN